MHRNADRSRPQNEMGATFAEILVAVALLGTITAFAVPTFTTLRREAALHRAATHIAMLMLRGRARAILRNQTEALVFERLDDGWHCFLAEDGDGDGVRHDDLHRGRDRITSEVLQIAAGGAGLGILAGVRIPDPSGRGRLRGNLNDPVRAGRGDIITFTRYGTATSSSVYFSDGVERMRVLRVIGTTGRMRQLMWRRGWPRWKPTN